MGKVARGGGRKHLKIRGCRWTPEVAVYVDGFEAELQSLSKFVCAHMCRLHKLFNHTRLRSHVISLEKNGAKNTPSPPRRLVLQV